MRSYHLFGMNLAVLEKYMEREWHLREGRANVAADIQKFDLDKWTEDMAIPRWSTRVNKSSFKKEATSVSFNLEVGRDDKWLERYSASIHFSDQGVFWYKVDLLGEDQKRFDITELKDGPYQTEELYKVANAIEYTVDD